MKYIDLASDNIIWSYLENSAGNSTIEPYTKKVPTLFVGEILHNYGQNHKPELKERTFEQV